MSFYTNQDFPGRELSIQAEQYLAKSPDELLHFMAYNYTGGYVHTFSKGIWMEIMEKLYHSGLMADLISAWFQHGHFTDLKYFHSMYVTLIQFLETKGEFDLAIRIAWILEGYYNSPFGSDVPNPFSIYVLLIRLYKYNGQEKESAMVMDHWEYLMKEKDIYYTEAERFFLLQPSQITPQNTLHPDLLNYCEAKYSLIGTLSPKDQENLYIRQRKTIIPLTKGQHLFLLARDDGLYLEHTFESGHPFIEAFIEEGIMIAEWEHNTFAWYEKTAKLAPHRNGIAYGEHNKKYLLYLFEQEYETDLESYLFWMLADGKHTLEEISHELGKQFQITEEWLLRRQTVRIFLKLYHNGLIWLNLPLIEKEDSNG